MIPKPYLCLSAQLIMPEIKKICSIKNFISNGDSNLCSKQPLSDSQISELSWFDNIISASKYDSSSFLLSYIQHHWPWCRLRTWPCCWWCGAASPCSARYLSGVSMPLRAFLVAATFCLSTWAASCIIGRTNRGDAWLQVTPSSPHHSWWAQTTEFSPPITQYYQWKEFTP